MNVMLRGKNIDLTPALRGYVEKKVGRIERFIDQPVEAQVNLYVERGRHIVEVTANVNGLLIRGEEATNDMYASIDLVANKLEKQVQRYRSKFRSQRQKEAAEPDSAVEAAPEADGRLIKTKRFPVKPLPVEEAIIQMNLLSHDFFVFTNAESEQVNVLYRRKDGNYGLLVPEV